MRMIWYVLLALVTALGNTLAGGEEPRLKARRAQAAANGTLGEIDGRFEQKWEIANTGRTSSVFRTGVAFERRFDLANARKAYRQAAEEGLAPAQYRYASLLRCDSKNPTQALRWFEAAVEQGYAPAMNALGLMYLDGEGVPVNLDRAIAMFTRASELEYAPAMNNLGIAYALRNKPEDLGHAQEALRKAASSGNRFATRNAEALRKQPEVKASLR